MKDKIVCANCGESDPDLIDYHCIDHDFDVCFNCRCPQCYGEEYEDYCDLQNSY